jgi:transposase-like protein
MTIDATTLTLSSLAKRYSDEDAAYQFVESLRWPHGPICPHCGLVGEATHLAPKAGERKTRTGKVSNRRVWQCNSCRQQFSVLIGTIFEDSKIPLSKWLLGIHLMCAGKNGVAALELKRELGIAYRSAWFMAHRIRYAMAHESFDKPSAQAIGAKRLPSPRFTGAPPSTGIDTGKNLPPPDYPNREQIDRVAAAILAAGFATEEDDADEEFPYNSPHALNEEESRALRQFWAEHDSH